MAPAKQRGDFNSLARLGPCAIYSTAMVISAFSAASLLHSKGSCACALQMNRLPDLSVHDAGNAKTCCAGMAVLECPC